MNYYVKYLNNIFVLQNNIVNQLYLKIYKNRIVNKYDLTNNQNNQKYPYYYILTNSYFYRQPTTGYWPHENNRNSP